MNRYKKTAEYLVEWYPKHARDLPWRKDKEPYHIWLSEIMLQQTRVEAVKSYYNRFLNELPTIKDLSEVSDERLLKLWEGLGYYNRAKNLKKAAITITNELNGQFPDTYEKILDLPGIGEYTAGAVSSICYNLPVPAVDGNVLRVCSRVTEEKTSIDKQSTKKKIRKELEKVYPIGKCDVFTQSLMELGATICVPNGVPKCSECPLTDICLSKAHNTWNEIPVRNKKKERKKEEKTVFMLVCGDRIAVRKRPANGILSEMWEFPNISGKLTEQQALDMVSFWNTLPKKVEMSLCHKHIFSHVEWHMTAYYIRCQQLNTEFQWITKKDLYEKTAIPSAFREFKKGLEILI